MKSFGSATGGNNIQLSKSEPDGQETKYNEESKNKLKLNKKKFKWGRNGRWEKEKWWKDGINSDLVITYNYQGLPSLC